MKSTFIQEMKERGYLNQCTDLGKLNEICEKKSISGYIGYCGIIYSSFFLKGNGSTNKIPRFLKIIALIWCIFVALCLLIPGQAGNGFDFE